MAPATLSIGVSQRGKARQAKMPMAIPPQKVTLDICRAVSGSFLPRARATALAPPTPNKLEMAVNSRNMGPTIVTAATCLGSFSKPTKYVSARW